VLHGRYHDSNDFFPAHHRGDDPDDYVGYERWRECVGRARNAAEQEVVSNAKNIAVSIALFYDEKASEKLFTLLAGHCGAVKDYSEATVAENMLQQDAALAHLASNADDISVFLSGANPHLPNEAVRGLIAAHGAHHVL
jgi:hypothetical protein